MTGRAAPGGGPRGGVVAPSMASYFGTASSRSPLGNAGSTSDTDDLDLTRGSAIICPIESFPLGGNVAKPPLDWAGGPIS